MFFLRRISVLFLSLAALAGCGSAAGPFEMSTATTQVVGDALPPDPQTEFLFNPQQQAAEGIVTAQIVEEYINRQELLIEDFEIVNEFPGVGPIRMVLNPNMESTATIYRLNLNNQLEGTHTMTLNLIVETPDQNLTYENVILSNTQAVLTLQGALPILGFYLAGQAMELQTLDLTVTIPAELVTSPYDPL